MHAAPSGVIHIDFQLRKMKQPLPDMAQRLLAELGKITVVKADARFWPHNDFPYMMDVDWERKFRYI
jgi:hypothetical protein